MQLTKVSTITVFAVLVGITICGSEASAQVTVQDVIDDAVNRPDADRRNDGYYDDYGRRDEYYDDYGRNDGYYDDYGRGEEYYDDYGRNDRYYDEYEYSDRDAYADEYRGRRRNSDYRESSREPDYWADVHRRVREAQPYGDRELQKRFNSDPHDASDIEQLPIDEDGVIDVNKMPDPPPSSSSGSDVVLSMETCCPKRSGDATWTGDISFCHKTWFVTNSAGEREFRNELWTKGNLNPKTGRCEGMHKVEP